jgi:hypothetical protein
MISLGALWLPILLSAVFVFIVSSILHMVLNYHAADFKKVPKEDEVMNALRPFDLAPGDYSIPRADNAKDLNTPEFKKKMDQGPVAMFTVLPNGQVNMTKNLVSWLVYCLIVGLFAGYVTSRTVGDASDYMEVFRFAGTTAFVGYSLALMQNSIWYGKSWAATFRSMLDGLVYALVTAGTFGWLWP